MAKIRSVLLWFKPSRVWLFGAALFLPVVAGIAVPPSPRIGGV
jgi:hypothetical protein